MKQHLDLLKYLWEHRNLDVPLKETHHPMRYLFNITIEPIKKEGWNRYGIWISQENELVNISSLVYDVISECELKEDIKLWQDKMYHCRPEKVETTGFAGFLLITFFSGIALVLQDMNIITAEEAKEPTYTFAAANYFKRLL